jgi:hypothetical protein
MHDARRAATPPAAKRIPIPSEGAPPHPQVPAFDARQLTARYRPMRADQTPDVPGPDRAQIEDDYLTVIFWDRLYTVPPPSSGSPAG